MGTRSAIGFAEFDGSVRAIYCHYDGYLEHNGRILNEYYDSIEAVEELLDMGDVVSLESTLDGCKFFARDNKAKNVDAQDFKDVSEFFEHYSNMGCEYFYLFDGEQWLVGDFNGAFRSLEIKSAA